MISHTFLQISLLVAMLVVPTEAAWFRHRRFHVGYRNIGAEQQEEGWHAADLSPPAPSATLALESYTFSVPNASIIAPSLTSQGMAVTSIVPIYEVCNTPGSNTTSCSTVFETLITTTCSTVLTYAFSKTTITECSLNITFSTQNSYTLATTTISPTTTLVLSPQALTSVPSSSSTPSPSTTTTTYVQSVVSYWYAPWQSLAAGNPKNITLLVCTWDFYNQETCTSVQEVWIMHTEYVLVSTTTTLSISTSLLSDAVFLLAPTQSVTAPAGNFTLSTQIIYSSMVPNATTSVSTLTSSDTSTNLGINTALPGGTTTSITTSTSTITITRPQSTVTITLSEVQQP